MLNEYGRQLNANHKSPFTQGYLPETENPPELDNDNINYYQEMIRCIKWVIELCQATIETKVAMLSRHLALPRHGNLDQCFNIYAYLKNHPCSKLVMNPAYMNVKYNFGECFKEEAE